MPKTMQRYCAPPEVIGLLNRDGIGWGHDLDCGCFKVEAPTKPKPFWKRLGGMK